MRGRKGGADKSAAMAQPWAQCCGQDAGLRGHVDGLPVPEFDPSPQQMTHRQPGGESKWIAGTSSRAESISGRAASEPPDHEALSLSKIHGVVARAVREEVVSIVPRVHEVMASVLQKELKQFGWAQSEPEKELPCGADRRHADQPVFFQDALAGLQQNFRFIVSEEFANCFKDQHRSAPLEARQEVRNGSPTPASREPLNGLGNAGEGQRDAAALAQTDDELTKITNAILDPDSMEAMEVEQEFAEAMASKEVFEEAMFSILPNNRWTRILHPLIHCLLTLKEPERVGFLARMVAHSRFLAICNIVILLNAMLAAYTADWDIKNLGSSPSAFIIWSEICFMAFYLVELVLKVIVHRLHFFCNSEWHWNAFDFCLVGLSVYEQVLAWSGVGSGSSITFMRMFRLLKLSKILRLFRALRFLQQLRLMMTAIARTMSALFWALMLLTFVIYVFGLVILQGLTGYLNEGLTDDLIYAGDPEVYETIMASFGSMPVTMLSLYKATTGGDDWAVCYDVVTYAGDLYALLFLFYIAFFTFAVVNILTGMIVENVAGLAQEDEQTALLQYRKAHKALQEDARLIFTKLDRQNVGVIESEAFKEALDCDQMHALMAALDLDVRDAHMFFQVLMDAGHAETVNIDTFVEGCTRMKGYATAIDMQGCLAEIRAMHTKLEGMRELLAKPKVEAAL